MRQTLKPTIPLLFFTLAWVCWATTANAQYSANGNASCTGDCCELTQDVPGQAGSIFNTSFVDLTQPFNLSVVLNFGCKDVNGADGIVFIFATDPTALGTGGGGIGYQGIPNSIGIEIDDYQNSTFGDPAADHMGMNSNGAINHNLVGPAILPNIEDCADHCFNVSWNPTTQSLTATLDATTISYTGDITAIVGSQAYYGFSSGTGSLSNLHTVCFAGPPLAPMTDVTICPGQNTTLQADPGGTSWQWQVNPTLSATNISNPIATPNTTTTYYVTINYACGYSHVDDVTVNVATPPTAMASSNSPICEGEDLLLQASGGLSYEWSGPQGFSSSDQNPLVSPTSTLNAGIYTVTVTDGAGCTGTGTTSVVVHPNPIVSILPVQGPLCTNGQPVQVTGIPSGGVWGGVANVQGQVNPMSLAPGIHTITYTFTNGFGCGATAETTVEVVTAPVVQIFPTDPFCQTDPPTYMLASPVGGAWTGAADPQGLVTPANLSVGLHTVGYFYTDLNGCSDDDEIEIEILPGTSVTIQPAGPFCPTALLQTLSASPTGGTWGGAATANGQINPAALGPGNHLVYYFYTPSNNGCPGADTILVQIYTPPSASISGNGTICLGSGQNVPITITATGAAPLQVTYVVNGQNPTTITVPSGNTNIPGTAPGTYTITGVVDANGCTSTGTGSANVTVVDAPTISNFDINCNGANTAYTVTFTVSGGDPATYSITGAVPGSLTAMPPYIFTSDPIPSGGGYSWVVNDANDCNPVTVSGSFNCICITDAGTMATGTLVACSNSTVTSTHNGDETLDANDGLIFVLHDGNGNSLGMVFSSNATGQFGLVPPMLTGVTYYVSAVAGDSLVGGGVDLSDPCLSVSFGQPVVFNPLPTANISGSAEICEGEPTTLAFAFTGNAPFDVTYTANGQPFTLDNVLNGHTMQVSPSATTTYTLVSVSDGSSPACSAPASASATVTVWPHVAQTQTVQICEGESVTFGGASQTTPGTYTDSLTTVHGCDSIIVTALVVHPLDTTYLNDASCNPANVGTFVQNLTNQNGCDSTVILTVNFSLTDTVFLASQTCDPAQAGIFIQNLATPEGCDSTVITTIALLASDTTQLFDTSCNPGSVGTFTQVLTNQNGCDSTVILTVSFSLTDSVFLASQTCAPASAGIFVQDLTTPDGCDSVVVTTVALMPSSTVNLSATTCDPAQAGIFTQNLANQFGCDSTVVTTVVYSPSVTTNLSATTCDPAPVGVFTQNLTTAAGCDSTVITTVTLLSSSTGSVQLTTCNPAQVGTTTVTLTNWLGCDSVVTITTTLLPPGDCGVVAALTGSTIPCGQAVGPLTLIVTTGTPPFNYTWAGPQGGSGVVNQLNVPQVVGNLPSGSYSVTVTAANGLTTTLTASILQTVSPTLSANVMSDFNGFAVSCFGETDGSASAIATGNQPPFSFEWSNGATNGTATGLAAGMYSVTVTDAAGCTATTNVSLNQPTALSLGFSISNLDCFGQTSGTITAIAEGGTAPYSYVLNGGASQTSGTFGGLAPGGYEVVTIDANGCSTSELLGISAPLPLDVELGDDLFLELGDGTMLNAQVSVPMDSVATVQWLGLDSLECPDCLQQPIVPLFTTTYSVTVMAENGCSDSDDLEVFVNRERHVYVPNAFSPNGDGVNEEFMVFAKEGTVANVRSFLVFSRWGEAVYQYFNFMPNNPAFGWDGKHRGEALDPAVFTWFAEVEFTDGEVRLYLGDVSLVR